MPASRTRTFYHFCLLVVLTGLAQAAFAARTIDLSGSGWSFKATRDLAAQPVTVPHSWLVQKGYETYIGHAIYSREFEAPQLAAGEVVRIHFGSVYDVAQVWLNGKRVGLHEGGYTPFEFDITRLLKPGSNQLWIDVDNTPTATSIPALAMGQPSSEKVPYGAPRRASMVGWMPYGGINSPVTLIVSPSVYLGPVKMDAKPNLATGDATLSVRAELRNAGTAAKTVRLQGTIAGVPATFRAVTVPAGGKTVATWSGTLSKAHLWSVRDPYLYDAVVSSPGDAYRTRIGVREVRVSGTQLLLNGRVVHLFGANRVADDPIAGLLESKEIVDRDLGDMLAANMRMMRIAHYPPAPALLDFADEHGMLLIPETGNWNMSAWQMADPGIRELFRKQHREMMESDWNHPSVIAWSMGNEYESYTPEGRDWTRDMRAYTLGLDSTRLITFASRYTSDPTVKTGLDEASQFSDFVSITVYGEYAKRLDHVHALYPDKPVFAIEFGKMGDAGLHDPERTAHVTEAVKAMKERDWVIGGSLWTWNDYRSLIKGTPANGIRSWGIVDVNRQHRDSWIPVQKLFATELP